MRGNNSITRVAIKGRSEAETMPLSAPTTKGRLVSTWNTAFRAAREGTGQESLQTWLIACAKVSAHEVAAEGKGAER